MSDDVSRPDTGTAQYEYEHDEQRQIDDHHETRAREMARDGIWTEARREAREIEHYKRSSDLIDELRRDRRRRARTDGGVNSTSGTEQLSYAGWAEDRSERKTVTITAVASDDEGLTEIDKETMEVEMPARGCLKLEIDGERISLEPNSVDGNPRVER